MSDKIEELEAAIAVEDKAIAAAEVVAKQKEFTLPRNPSGDQQCGPSPGSPA